MREKLKVVKLQCENCDTVIENDFCLSKFDYLSTEDLFFAETFLKCRGNIKEVEKELKISYPQSVPGWMTLSRNWMGIPTCDPMYNPPLLHARRRY